MALDDDARRSLDDYLDQIAGRRRQDAAARRELESHILDAAAERARDAGRSAATRVDVEEAVRRLGPPQEARSVVDHLQRILRRRIRLTTRGLTALGLAAVAVAVATVLFATTLVCATGTDALACDPWPVYLLLLALAAAAGVWTAIRWIPLVCALPFFLLPLLGGHVQWGTLAGLLLLTAAVLAPGPERPVPGARAPWWKYALVIPVAFAAWPLSEGLFDEVLGLHTEGAFQEIGLMVVTFAVLFGAYVWVVGNRSIRFAGGAAAVGLVAVAVSFALVFFLSFAGSGCNPYGPPEAYWHDDDLYSRLPHEGTLAGLTVRYVAPPTGIPFANDTVQALVGPGNYSLATIWWSGDGTERTGFLEDMRMAPEGRVEWTWPEQTRADTVRAISIFIENATEADATQALHYAQQMVADAQPMGRAYHGPESSTQVYRGAINVSEPARAPQLWSEQDAASRAAMDPPLEGLPSGAAAWRFSLAFASKTVTGTVDTANETDAAVAMTVSALGDASMTPADAESDRADLLVQRIHATYQALDAGPAPVTAADVHQPRICVD